MPRRRHGWLLLTLLLLLLPARPAAADELQGLLDAVAVALGGRERLEALDGYRMEAGVRGMGMDGRAVTWAVFPGRHRDELQLGPLAMVLVLDGEQGWHRDHNGLVVQLDEFDLGTMRTSTYVDSMRPWLDPPDPQVIALAGTTDVDGRACPTVWILPPGGNPVWIAFDPEDFLPLRAHREDASGLGLDITLYGDYRDIDGVQIPFRVESYHEQLPSNRMVYTVTAVELSPAWDDERFQRPEDRPDVILPPGEDTVTIPLEIVSGHLFVHTTVDGPGATAAVRFLLDTGSTLSMIDADLARSLGLVAEGDLTGHAIGGTTEVSLVQIPSMDVGDARLLHQVLGTAVFGDDLTEQLGVPVGGLLGYDFFSRFVVFLDFDGRSCTLHEPGTWSPPADGVVLPLQFVEQQPTVEATLDGDLSGRWRVDTGADGLAVHGPQAAAWDLEQRHPGGRDMVATGLAGPTIVRLVRADSFRLGPYEIRQPLMLVSRDEAGVLAAGSIAGNIGTGILDRFHLTVDFPGSRLHLVPGKAFGRLDRVRTVDFVIGWAGTELRVVAVQPGGDGEIAGLREGQQVLRLDGKPAARWSGDALTALWSGEGARSVLVVVREPGPPVRKKRIRINIPPGP